MQHMEDDVWFEPFDYGPAREMSMHDVIIEQTAVDFNRLIRAAKASAAAPDDWAAFCEHAKAEARIKAKTAFLWDLIIQNLTGNICQDPIEKKRKLIHEALANMTQHVCCCPERMPQ